MEELGDGSRDKLGALSLLQLSQAADVLGETPIAILPLEVGLGQCSLKRWSDHASISNACFGEISEFAFRFVSLS